LGDDEAAFCVHGGDIAATVTAGGAIVRDVSKTLLGK
jgi:hypothetical protein